VRGDGGYVIVPPSRRWPDGKPYEANQPLDPAAIAEAPQWLYELVSPRRKLPVQDGAFPYTPENERKLRDALSNIPAEARDMWLKVGGALNSLGQEWGSVARELWDEWSQTEPGSFDAEDQDATWEGFDPARPKVATVATIFF
jgi:Primase C terminal 2 (PriCT-2)/Bifunctional DNA primase/polymerase, N-terminal